MSIGPVQLLVLGFARPDFDGEIVAELRRLREHDLVRVVDALAVYKDADGDVALLQTSELGGMGDAEFGSLVGPLVGAGTVPGAGEPDDDTDDDLGEGWDVLAEIPPDSAAALILLEHRWAVPLGDAVARAGGFRLASEFVSPLDLVALGLVGPAEATALASSDRDAI